LCIRQGVSRRLSRRVGKAEQPVHQVVFWRKGQQQTQGRRQLQKILAASADFAPEPGPQEG
jgi:hypothetical protein